MNIFFLDRDPRTCAIYHCDKHVVKMCLEYSQILQTAMHSLGYDTKYKPTHKNHPCVKWVAASIEHWNWVHDLALCLNDEYKYRYNKSEDHRAITALIDTMDTIQEVPGLYPHPDSGWIDPPCAMPEELFEDSVVESYRRYYRDRKAQEMELTYTGRNRPEFLSG